MYNKLKGFTLAEVLITLGIIGVVAAMTIPVLIGQYKEKVLETQYKKGVNIISTALQAIMAEEGTPGDLSNTPLNTCYQDKDAACFADVVSKYFKTSYTSDNQSFKDNFEAIEYTAYLPSYMAGGVFVPKAEAIPSETTTCNQSSCPSGYKLDPEKNGALVLLEDHDEIEFCCIPDVPEDDGYYWKRTTYGFQTTDGIAFGFMESDGTSYPVLMDVNGLKAPNKINQDLYVLNVNRRGVVSSSSN